MANGSFKSNLGIGLDVNVVWKSSVNSGENSSTVTIEEYVHSYSINVPARPAVIVCGNEEYSYTAPAIRNTQEKLKKTLIGSRSFVVQHDSDGSKQINIECRWRFNGTYGGHSVDWIDVSKTVTLDNIDISLPEPFPSPKFITQPNTIDVTNSSIEIDFEATGYDKIFSSIDGQTNWEEQSSTNFVLSGLKPYTLYNVYVALEGNGKTVISNVVSARTLPVYIEEIYIPEEIYVDIGKAQDIPITTVPENANTETFIIISSNTDVIAVEKRKLVGVRKGISEISIVDADSGIVYAKTTAFSIKRAEGVIVSPSSIIINRGTSVGLSVSVLPIDAENKEYTLTSSDIEVVSVYGDTITALKDGTAIVSAISEDGGFKNSVTITVEGDHVWYQYDTPLEYLNADDVNQIQSNIYTIKDMLENKGYDFSYFPPMSSVEKSMFLYQMNTTLQDIEASLDTLNSTNYQSIYWVDFVTISEYASNSSDIWRWILILNDMYGMLKGEFGKWRTLLCIDGYPTIGGKKIVLREETADTI